MFTQGGTGWVRRMLTGAAGEVATFTPGGAEVQFQFRNLPVTEDGKAYYAAAIDFEIRATGTGDASHLQRETYAKLLRSLLGSIRLYSTFRGSMLEAASWSSAMRFHTASYVANGYRNPLRPHLGDGVGLQDAAANVLHVRGRIPLGLGLGAKPDHTWPLVAELKEGFLGITPAAAGLNLIDAGLVFGAVTIRCSILMQPRPELVLGPGIEMQVYSGNTPSGTTFDGRIDDWGQKSGFGGNVTRDAGVVWAGVEGESTGGMDGLTGMGYLTELEIPWRDIYGMRDPKALFEDARDAEGRPGWLPDVLDRAAVTAANPIDISGGYPHLPDNVLSQPITETSTYLYSPSAYVGVLPFVNPGRQLELSKLQVAKSALAVRMLTSGTFSGKFNVMALQAKEWTSNFREEWVRMCVREGLAKEVLGRVSSPADLTWSVKNLRKQDPRGMEPAKMRFLPTRLQSKNEGRKVRV